MNYIKQLQTENKEFKARVDSVDEQLRDFSRLLHSAKHNGIDINGDRSDWIATNDVISRLGLIHDALYGFNQ